jgi:hypothetical protein
MGINFQPDMIAEILAGRKRCTWRPAKDGETVHYATSWSINGDLSAKDGDKLIWKHTASTQRVPVGLLMARTRLVSVFSAKNRLKFRVEASYALGQGRAKPSYRYEDGWQARIIIREMETFRPSECTLSTAKLEGFAGVNQFHDKLRFLYGEDFDLETLGYSILFDLEGRPK